jgi:sulfur relay (sulfurtransferase) complex TusBCD TusD component (DsrE family)
MKLLLVLHSGPGHPNVTTVKMMAKEAVAAGHEVTIFAMSEGVLNLADPEFTGLTSTGLHLTVCDHNRGQFGATAGIDHVLYGSQFNLAGYVADADRVVSFAQEG